MQTSIPLQICRGRHRENGPWAENPFRQHLYIDFPAGAGSVKSAKRNPYTRVKR